jgi:hypothetical protein
VPLAPAAKPAKHIHLLHVLAHLDAAATLYTLLPVQGNGGRGLVVRGVVRRGLAEIGRRGAQLGQQRRLFSRRLAVVFAGLFVSVVFY